MIIPLDGRPHMRLEAVYGVLRELRRDLYATGDIRLGYRSRTALEDCKRMINDIERDFVVEQEEESV